MSAILSMRVVLNLLSLALALFGLPSAARPVLVCMDSPIKCFEAMLNETTGVLTGDNNAPIVALSTPSTSTSATSIPSSFSPATPAAFSPGSRGNSTVTFSSRTNTTLSTSTTSNSTAIISSSSLDQSQVNITSTSTLAPIDHASNSTSTTSTTSASTPSANATTSIKHSQYYSPPLVIGPDILFSHPLPRAADSSVSTKAIAEETKSSSLPILVDGLPILPRRRLRHRSADPTAEFNPDADPPTEADADANPNSVLDMPTRLAHSQELAKTEQSSRPLLWARLAARLRPRVTAACMGAIWLCPGSLYYPTEGGPGRPGEIGG